MTDRELMQQAMKSTPHKQLIDELLDSRIPKTEREHAAAREIEKLRERLAHPEQEPAAWAWYVNSGAGHVSCGTDFMKTSIPFARHIPLYTSPQQHKSLTEEEIEDEWESVTGHNISHGDRQEGRAMYISPDEVTEFARAVIAKATGEKE